MPTLSNLYAKYQRKKMLLHQMDELLTKEKEAQQQVVDARVVCERENLDIKKFENNEFVQFWSKIRGEFEKKQLENNAKAASAMRKYHEAQAKVFDIAQEKHRLEKELKELEGVEEAYQEALAKNLEHLDYSIHREEVVRRQNIVSGDEYQLSILETSGELASLSIIKAENLLNYFKAIQESDDVRSSESDKIIQNIIREASEIKVFLHRLEADLQVIDSLETSENQFGPFMNFSIVDIFFDKNLNESFDERALIRGVNQIHLLIENLKAFTQQKANLVESLKEIKDYHLEQLERFVSETQVGKTIEIKEKQDA